MAGERVAASPTSLTQRRYVVELPGPMDLATDSSAERASILLVDDTPANLASLRAILGDLGHDLVEARSCAEALERAKAQEFAAVLIGMRRPGRGGFDTAEAIRADERLGRRRSSS